MVLNSLSLSTNDVAHSPFMLITFWIDSFVKGLFESLALDFLIFFRDDFLQVFFPFCDFVFHSPNVIFYFIFEILFVY